MKSDSELQKSVSCELAGDTRLDAAAVGVSVHHGVVTLNGAVESWSEKHAAEEAAHRVAGVLDVANDIEIKPSWSTRRSAADVAKAVRRALEGGVPCSHRLIQSTVCDAGHITLTGTVGTLLQRDDVERVVRSVEGVRFITNRIAVEPPRIAASELRSSIKAALEEALERHVAREADHIEIDVRDDMVVLSGKIASWIERDAVISAAKGTPGVRRIEDQLRIER